MRTDLEIKEEITKTKNIIDILKGQYSRYFQVETAIDIAKNEAYIEALEFVLDGEY